MTDRVYMGELNGAFVARVSRPGFDVKTAPIEGLLFREDTFTIRPIAIGSFAFGGSGSQSIALGALANIPFVILKSSDNTVPAHRDYRGEVFPDGTFKVNNLRNVARTIYYFVFNQV